VSKLFGEVNHGSSTDLLEKVTIAFTSTVMWPVNPAIFKEQEFLPSRVTDLTKNQRTMRPAGTQSKLSSHTEEQESLQPTGRQFYLF
jgi:hypothetical protein